MGGEGKGLSPGIRTRRDQIGGSIGFVVMQYCPRHPQQFIRKGDNHYILMGAGCQLS